MASENNGADVSSSKARGAFDLGGSKSKKARPIKIYLMIALVVVLFVGGIVGMWALLIGQMSSSSEEVNESAAVTDPTLVAQQAEDTSLQKLKAEKIRQMEEDRIKAEEEAKKQEKQSDLASPTTSATPGGNLGVRSAPAALPPSPAELRKLGSNLLVKAVVSDVSGVAGGATQPDVGSPRNNPPPGAEFLGDSPAFSSSGLDGGGSPSRGNLDNLSGPTFLPTRAFLSPPGKYLLRHNTYARCVLYTEIKTEHPGFVDCRLTDPLYSADGSTVLAEAGARVDGVQTVQMKAGQATVFTSWTELETTAGVRVRIDSLGAGPMGASGTEAWINNHWKDRFGGAVMLTLFKDGLGAVTAKSQSNNNSGYTLNNTEQNVESMADKALDSTINIAPTGHVLPGRVLTIIVARDVDFSSVYRNH